MTAIPDWLGRAFDELTDAVVLCDAAPPEHISEPCVHIGVGLHDCRGDWAPARRAAGRAARYERDA
jgi:hypothetical protein